MNRHFALGAALLSIATLLGSAACQSRDLPLPRRDSGQPGIAPLASPGVPRSAR